MSELEKTYREEYRAKRKKFMLYQQIGLGIVAVLLLIFSVMYFKTDKEAYVYYSEDGNAIHYAYLKDGNGFFEDGDYLNGSHAYVSSLIDHMRADFTYKLKFDTDKVKYTYTYGIDTQLEILDVPSGAPVYNPTERTVLPTSVSGEGNSFVISQSLENIDFNKYNEEARRFIDKYGLKETSSTLIIRMNVSVVGVSEMFGSDHKEAYVTELRIPLCKLAFKPTVSSAVPSGEKKILAVSGNTRQMYGVLAVISLVGLILDSAVYIVFVIITRDKFIDYARKVQRICKNYKSYIQRIENDFDTSGCRVLRLNDFSAMLEIRDTVQKPILMYENADRTLARFFILCDSIVYLQEIKVLQTAQSIDYATEAASAASNAAEAAPAAEDGGPSATGRKPSAKKKRGR